MEEANEILVEVKNVSKKFSRSLKRGMWYGLKDVAGSMLGRKGNRTTLRNDEFWAVRDINFQLRRGECLGLIGRNGAGKSTLLKMLNGLIRPDEGSITIRGKVGALIELGAGFNPILTGRENIYVNGQVLGFSKKEIDSKLKDILDFAEIGEFIDSPIQNYSSGMKVRLGFAIAAQMEPDVLIIDEVLAVGDLGFVLKCFNTIDNLMGKTAVIFVSHGMPQVSRICSAIMLMEKGQSIFHGNDVSKGIDMYYSKFENRSGRHVIFDRDQDAIFEKIEFGKEAENQNGIYCVNHLEDLVMNIHLRTKETIPTPFLAITIFDKEQRAVGVCQAENGLNEKNIVKKENGYIHFQTQLTIPRINLSKGVYMVSFTVFENYRAKPILRLQSVTTFQVSSKSDVWPPVEFEGFWS